MGEGWRLTPDLFLPAALADGYHVLLELPTVTAHEAHSSGLCLDCSARVRISAASHTVRHLVRLHRPATVRLNVVISGLLLSALFARLLLSLTSTSLALSFGLAEPPLVSGPADALVPALPLVGRRALTLLALVTTARVQHLGLRLFILVHIAARSNLMATFCRLEEVDQLGIDVNLLETAVETGCVPQVPQFQCLFTSLLGHSSQVHRLVHL